MIDSTVSAPARERERERERAGCGWDERFCFCRVFCFLVVLILAKNLDGFRRRRHQETSAESSVEVFPVHCEVDGSKNLKWSVDLAVKGGLDSCVRLSVWP